MDTCINDDFPFDELECQYYDVCKFYKPQDCEYAKSCPTYLKMGEHADTLRYIYRNGLENDVAELCLRFQISLIVDEDKE